MTNSARTIRFISANRGALGGALSALILACAALSGTAAAAGEAFAVEERAIDDLKAVFATVRSTDEIYARVRTGGTIASLAITKGAEVKMGDVLATITDQKLALRMRSLDAQIVGLKSRAETAHAERQRQEQLAEKGYAAGAKLDEARAGSEVASNALKSAEAERQVITQQVQEGEVLAPANGRVLTIPVTAGSVVMPGEAIAKIAANAYVCGLRCPSAMRASSRRAIRSPSAAARCPQRCPHRQGLHHPRLSRVAGWPRHRRRAGRGAWQILRGRAGPGVDFGRQAANHRRAARLLVPALRPRLCPAARKRRQDHRYGGSARPARAA